MSNDTPSGQAQHVHMPASFLAKTAQDPAQGWPHAPRDFGRDVIPHVFSVGARMGTISNTYPWYDEALKDSPNNAEIMRTETGVMECLEARQRGSALCRWHIEARDSKSQAAVDLAEKVSAIVEETPYFVDLRRCLLEALWYGRYLTTHRIGSQNIDGQPRQYIKHWTPRHGDKIAFRFDDGSGEYSDDQIGLRVAATWSELRKQVDFRGQQIDKVQPTQRGLVYWFDDRDRERSALHRHLIEDGAFQDPRAIGRINGVGIRDRIYWAWYGMQECMSNALNFIERNAHGIEIWRYPAGNKEAHDKTVEAAENRSNKSVLLVPVQPGELADLQSVEVVEPGFAGLDALMGIVQNYYGHKIKRYILGQVLTSEAAATGLGSGVADAHLATFADIVRYDAFKLEETITKDIVRPLQLFNFPKSHHIKLRFRLDTESEDMESKLAAWERAWNIGARIPESDLMSIIGARMPNEDDRTLENPQMAQAQQQMQMQEQQMQMQQQQMAMQGQGGPGGGTNPQAGEPGGRREPDPETVFPPMGEAGAALGQMQMQQASRREQPGRYAENPPSEAQREAGNYVKDHVSWQGLDISIENRRGTRRRPEWPPLPADYGYIRGTEGRDGDHVDVFLGPDRDCQLVHVIDRQTPGKRFDEHKCFIGFRNRRDVLECYREAYDESRASQPVTAMTVDQFKAWLAEGDTTRRAAKQVSRYSSEWDEDEHPRDNQGQFTAYHGTDADFAEFDQSKRGTNYDDDASRNAWFLSSTPEGARRFGRHVQKVQVRGDSIADVTDEMASEYEQRWLADLEESDPEEHEYQISTKAYQNTPNIRKGVELAVNDLLNRKADVVRIPPGENDDDDDEWFVVKDGSRLKIVGRADDDDAAEQSQRYSQRYFQGGGSDSQYTPEDLLIAGIRHEMDRGLSQREARSVAHRNLRRDPSYYRMLVADLWRMELEETDDIITPGDKTRYGVEWDESKHRRDEDGKFAEKGRASGSRGEPRFAIRDELEPGQWTGGVPQRGGNGKARFTIGEDTYTFKAVPFHNHPEIPIDMNDLSGHSVSFQHEAFGHSPSGGGNARAVFRHVLGAVLDMIHQGSDILIFSGATPQHEKLYHNMMRLYAKHLPRGYSAMRFDTTDGSKIFGIVSARAGERIDELLGERGDEARPASPPAAAANQLADLQDEVPILADLEDYVEDALYTPLTWASGIELTWDFAADMGSRWSDLGKHVGEHGWDVPFPGTGHDPRDEFEELISIAHSDRRPIGDGVPLADDLPRVADHFADEWSELAGVIPTIENAYVGTGRHLANARIALQRGDGDSAVEYLDDARYYADQFSPAESRAIHQARRQIAGTMEDGARERVREGSDLEAIHRYTLDGQPERYVARDEWDESLHPRDEEGKFVEKGQGRGGRAASTPGADRRLAETLAEQGILQGAEIRSHEKGLRVSIPGHGNFDVRTVPQETLRKMAARHAEQARKSARAGGHEIVGEIGGVYSNGRLILADDFTDGELNHEIVHALQDMGVITSKEINLFGGREGMAYAYQQWVAQGEPPNSIFQRIKDFLTAIFRPREYRKQQALRKLDRGEALEDVRRHEDAATSFAARAAELGAPIDGDVQERNSTPIMDPDDPWTGISDDGGINVARVLFATRDPDQWLQKAKKDPGIRRLYGAGELDRIAGQMRGTAKIINGLRARLPWDEETGNPIRSNADELFGDTFDVTTVCPKQELYVDVIRNLQKRHRRLFDKKERFLIGRMMQEVGMGPACWYCYGQQSRDNAAQTTRNAAELFQNVAREHDKNNLQKWLKNPDDPESEKALKEMWDPSSPTSNRWSFRNNNPQSDQYGQPSRFAAYAYQYAGDPEAQRLWQNKPHRVYDLAMGYGKPPQTQMEADTKKAVRAATPSANDPKGWASYTGHALRMDPERIKKYNQSAGFRMNSQADFSPWHTVEVSQFLTDLGSRKGQAHAYTRVPEFVDIFGDTGVKFNLSCGYATDRRTGELQRDAKGPIWDMDSFPREKALEARQSNPNAGTMLVPLNTEQLLTGLDDPNIDMMIPYHAGAVPIEVTREQHAENFEAWQHEDYSNSTLPGKPAGAPRSAKPPSVRVTLSGGQKVKIHRGQQITREHHGGDKAQYLELCDKLKITPRFPQLCGRGEQAKSVPNHPLSGVNTDHPNYMKLVKDVARDDTPQKAVDGRRVNWDAANRHLRTFARQQPAKQMQGHNNELLKVLSRRIQRGEWPSRTDPSTGEPVIPLEGRGRRSRRHQQSDPGAALQRYAAETPEQTVARYRRIAEHAWAEPTSAV